jgi:hypothetical protein
MALSCLTHCSMGYYYFSIMVHSNTCTMFKVRYIANKNDSCFIQNKIYTVIDIKACECRCSNKDMLYHIAEMGDIRTGCDICDGSYGGAYFDKDIFKVVDINIKVL